LLLVFGSIRPGHTANTCGSKLIIGGIDHVSTAEPFVSRLFPFGNKRGVDQLLIDAVLVDGCTDSLVCIVQIVNVPALLPADLMDRPHGFGLSLVEICFFHLVADFILERLQDGLDKVKTGGRLTPFLVPFLGKRHSVSIYVWWKGGSGQR
jgi:hypothetical protein